MLNERLEHLKEDIIAHGQCRLHHLFFGSAWSERKRVKLDKHARQAAHLEDSLLDHIIEAEELIKFAILLTDLSYIFRHFHVC